MQKKGMRRKSLATLTIFCLSMLSLFGLVLTNVFSGIRVAEAAVTSWNIGTDGDLVITTGGEYYVIGSTTANTITVNTSDPVSITLDNVSIDVSGTAGKCAFDSGADVTVCLIGINSLKSGDLTLEGILGQPGLKVQENDSLVIYEDPVAGGSLTATGGNRGAGIGGEGGKDGGAVTIESGTVAAIGGLGAAGIGGGGDVLLNGHYDSAGGSGGLLTVNGGKVTATGGRLGAGIGSGAGEPDIVSVEKGVTTINGGTVTATGGESGAGIGGGTFRSNGTFHINAGSVTAIGGDYGAGVGGGNFGSGGTVTIQGGELIAQGGGLGAGIGGGNNGSGAAVDIENAIVSATGGSDGAGIGSGGGGGVNAGTVNIISGTVTAKGGGGGAGIGGGSRNNGAEVTINGGTVTATGGAQAAGIGGGVSSVVPGGFNTITHGGKLTVNDGEVTASGGQYSAGIGGSYWGSGAEVVINGGRVEAYGSGWGAGIGGGGNGGQYGTVGTATINGGYVKAVGGEAAAGIGGGHLQPGGEVTISGGEVIAQGGADGAGIGGGREKAGGTVIIRGGSIAATGGNLSAGIGGGAYGFGGEVTISNGTVTAIGGTNGAGIGAGLNSPGGTVMITGGSIKAVGNNSDAIGGSGGNKGTGTLTNGTEPLELRVMENYVAAEDPEPVNIELTVNRSTPDVYSYVYRYFGKGHGAGDTNLYFYLPVRTATSLTLASSQNPSSWGDPVTLTAGLDTTSATGTVKFFDGDVLLGTSTLNNGQAVFDIDSLVPGVHALRAEYQGDEYFAPSTATVINQTVNKLPTILTLSGDPNPAAIGSAVNFTASVDPAEASGQVEFYDGETLIGTLNLADGSAVLTTDELTLGTHSIKAVYQGDEYYAAGNSNVVEQEITKVPTALTLTSSRNPSAFGESVVFTATVDPLSATGSIDFYDNGMWMGRTPISEGNALFATYYSLTLGSHCITAEYAGNEIYAPCISDVIDQSVRPRLSGISASFNQGSMVIYPVVPLDNLKSMLTVTAQYDDGSSTPVAPTDCTLSGTLTPGTSVITVQYGGKETTFTVNVTARAVTGISITMQPIKTSYIAGQSFDPAGMEVTAQYNDGTSEAVTGYTYAPSGALNANDTKVTVTYAGKTADVTIDVFDKSVSGINASFNQGSVAIYPATSLDTLKSMLTVTAQYNDGSSSPVAATDYTLSGTLAPGTSVITVQYGGKETTFTVNVTARALTGISITKQPIKTSYIAGQSFDPAGMEVTARYNDGTSEAVTGYTYAPSGALSTNDTKVTVTYAGKTAVVTITVTTSDLNKTITGVQPLDLIRVPKGTSREKLPLPSEVLVTLSNGAALSCPVSWNNGNPEYNSDPGRSTAYTFIGTLNCPSGVNNPIDLHAIAIVNVFGAIPNNSVIIWSKAYSIDYMMKENNLGEINQAIAQAGLKPIYFQLPGVAEVFTDVFTMAAATPDELTALPEIDYTDAQGNKTTYAAGFGDAIPPGV